MVFGELVNTVPMFGSQRKPYILIGALLMATGLLILVGVAGRWLTFAPDQLYVLGAMLVAIGTVLQDVVADAMSTEVVPLAPIPWATSARTTVCAWSSAWCRC
jgi:hypothetical protein